MTSTQVDSDESMQEAAQNEPAQPTGLILKARYDVAKVVRTLCRVSDSVVAKWYWPILAILVGALPFLLSMLTGFQGHQTVSALLLSWMCLGFAFKDRWVACIVAIGLVYLSHSITVILFSQWFPEYTATFLPGAAKYWERQEKWITTGENDEYLVSSWLPGHIQMAFGVSVFTFISFGAVVFHNGFIQVDVMNYYNAQLASTSHNSFLAIGYGWHIWSIARGVGYLFLTFELISLAVQCISTIKLSTWRRRLIRWGLGLSFLVLDCLIKFLAVDYVRERLYENWVF